MPTQPFDAAVRNERGTAIIDLQGEINALADETLNTAFDKAEEQYTDTIILNFDRVDYINSTGIALIVGLLARARKARRRLLVFGLSEHYVEIFQITRLADFMDIYQDEVSALTGAGAAVSQS
jgi:anti-anti-sigma factor